MLTDLINDLTIAYNSVCSTLNINDLTKNTDSVVQNILVRMFNVQFYTNQSSDMVQFYLILNP